MLLFKFLLKSNRFSNGFSVSKLRLFRRRRTRAATVQNDVVLQQHLFAFLLSSQPKSSSSSSSTLQSLPQPSTNPSSNSGKSSSLFSNLPNPKSQIHDQQPRKVVQFRPPVISLPKPTELEDDIEEEQERNRRRNTHNSIQAPSVKSFLSTIPAPRNSATLGVQSSSGSGRRSIIETEAPESTPAPVSVSAWRAMLQLIKMQGIIASYGNHDVAVDQSVEAGSAEEFMNYANYPGYGYASYSDYGDNVQYGNNWVNGLPEASGVSDNAVKFPGKKRGRHEIPIEVIEVKQEELIKNRPREDQVKLTGLAFGPSY
ncbi:hypothetical protein Lalb_Chr13g0299941 [Lupinus albus]|uniref:Uncharacterized protein n=1 Tax=Lupinus albus TaxID=3870 RepID=A0A6A4PJL1_LUPAL|nr:hypothetical protein Lalb_Chr13g0299941 [Lupinus albus]